MRTSVLSTALVVALVGIACSDDTTAPANDFSAALTGAQEVPAVASDAAAHATISIRGDSIIYTLTITTAASSNFTTAHIHAGTNTGGTTNSGTGSGLVRVNLCGAGSAPACPTGTGTVSDTIVYSAGTDTLLNSGSGTGIQSRMTFDGLVSTMRAFGAYVNLHTATNTGGEIRGQIVPDAP